MERLLKPASPYISSSLTKLAILLLLVSSITVRGWAAPCCGGSSLLPQLITSDDFAQFSGSLSQGYVLSDALANGTRVDRASDEKESTQLISLHAAYLLWDRFQAGIEIPLHRRTLDFGGNFSASTGLGDISLDVAYEFLPELTYSPWKPKGFVYAQASAPLGTSVYETNDASQVHGKGFWNIGLGVAFLKTIGDFDFLLAGEGHVIPARSFSQVSGERRFSGGMGLSGVAALGFSPGGGWLRLGSSFQAIYEGAREVTTRSTQRTEPSWSGSLSAQLSARLENEWTLSLAYANQEWSPFARNTDLSWDLAFSAIKRLPL